MKQFFEKFSYIFKYRIAVVGIVLGIIFAFLIVHLFNIQIIHGESYKEGLTTSIKKVVNKSAMRGSIYDRNGVLLAYDDIAYAVNLSDSGSYSTVKEKNNTINSSIIRVLGILNECGEKYTNDFKVEYKNNEYRYTVSGNELLGFLRDCYGVATISELTEEQKNTKAPDLIAYLIDNYDINQEGLSKEDLFELLYLRVNLTANSYSRYMKLTIVNEISDKTMGMILEEENNLTGITVDENYVRKYNNAEMYSAIIGYTGLVSSEELEGNEVNGTDYEYGDIIGKNGIEEIYNSQLQGVKGQQEVYLDTVGHITQVVSETESIVGKDIYLTIDSRLQEKLYTLLEDKITEVVLEKLTSGTTKYSYASDGSVSDIYILMNEVYVALIKNNLVKISSIASPETELEKEVNEIFLTGQSEAVDVVRNEMTTEGTDVEELSDADRNYVYGVYDNLCSTGLINEGLINKDDPYYLKWEEGKGITLSQFLKYALSSGWVDTAKLSADGFLDTEGVYNKLVEETIDNIKSSRDFSLIIYENLITDEDLSGRDVCLLLYDQGYLDTDDDYYEALKDGDISAEGFIRSALENDIITPGELGLYPSSGGAVVEDPYTGEMLALVSYPGYDSNKLTGDMDVDYYNSLQYNSAAPMLNWATQATCAPGSIFKLCTSIASLEEGVAVSSTTVVCTGTYDEITPSPKCWIWPSSHGSRDMATAIQDSCNIYFYTMGDRLARSKNGEYQSDVGTDILKKYAEELGLATKSGIELEETTPHASDTSAISSAIGQGTATYSNVNIARYVSTICTNGKVYDSTVILKITEHKGDVVSKNEPKLANDLTYISSESWSTVHYGMELATSTYAALTNKSGLVACKTGTSQPSEYQPDNATFVSYAPLSDPEITLSIEIPFGYTSLNNTDIANDFYDFYFGDYSQMSNAREGLADYSSYVSSSSESDDTDDDTTDDEEDDDEED